MAEEVSERHNLDRDEKRCSRVFFALSLVLVVCVSISLLFIFLFARGNESKKSIAEKGSSFELNTLSEEDYVLSLLPDDTVAMIDLSEEDPPSPQRKACYGSWMIHS